VKAFIPGRSGRRVAGEGFVRGLGLLRDASLGPIRGDIGCKSAGPLNVGVVGVWSSA